MRRSYTKPALISLAQAASRVFVQTEVEQETLLDVGVTAEKLTIQGMGVDVESCTGGSRKNARKEWGIENHEIVIGHLANKSWEKGTIDLLRASQMAWQSGADFRLVLAGPEMRNFREFWATFEPKEKITLRGWLTENQKRDFFAGIDIFAMPSRSDSFGIVFLEAWMNRLPNLAYRAGGVASVIRHQVDGLLVRCGDLEGLARSIHHLVEDAPLRERLGQAGYAKTVTDFHWEDKLRLIEECYHETI